MNITDMPIYINIYGELLPLENIKIEDGKIIGIVSASALEERDLDGNGKTLSISNLIWD